MSFKYLVCYFLFEIVSFKVFKIIFSDLNMKYEYLDWIYYFYYPAKNVYFYFYLYFIFTTSVYFCLNLWINTYKEKRLNDE